MGSDLFGAVCCGRYGAVRCSRFRFGGAGVANEVGHGMVGSFRQARCGKVRMF